MWNPFRLPPAPPAFGAGKKIPERTASPLEVNDLWELPDERLAAKITDELEKNYYLRCPPADRPSAFRSTVPGTVSKSNTDIDEKDGLDSKGTPATIEAATNRQPKYDSSLFKALHATFMKRIWISGVLYLFASTLNTTTPLLNKVILTWLTDSYVYIRLSPEEKAAGILQQPRGIGYGIGLAFALFIMQELPLSGRARLEHTAGKITTMISTDTTRVDQFTAYGAFLKINVVILLAPGSAQSKSLGYSALVGLAVMVFGMPFQGLLVLIILKQREKGVKITDTRVRLTNEVLQGIRLLKMYSWEDFYTIQIGKYRAGEIAALRKTSFANAALIASITFIPALCTVLTFITYSLTGHDLNIAVVFTALQLFTIIRIPFLILPVILASTADLAVALKRVSTYLSAEELGDQYETDHLLPAAVELDGDFTWEATGKIDDAKEAPAKGKKKEDKKKGKKKGKKEKDPILPTVADEPDTKGKTPEEEEKPFELKGLKLSIPKGSFVAIVGRVGSGKSSVLQAMIGEMRKTAGAVHFGGTLAYVPQTAWIRNTTLRENIFFGGDVEEERFREVVKACHLEPDLSMLPQGEDTEIGEKGINLSGGQKARVSLARAAYSDSDIVLLDDPLSAVDAYVGKGILNECLLSGPLAKRTRILVTHALHVLDKTDYIYVMDEGVIVEQGTYGELMKGASTFANLMEEYGSLQSHGGKLGQVKLPPTIADLDQTAKKEVEAALMQEEERNTGAVKWEIYKKYLEYAGGLFWFPVVLALLVINEASQGKIL
ncbi:hypothetical protein H0H92_006790 [Tricholoma furcatifolium]|nr:hypothetical protein H0H92_006790 [Tricholoma furcatifolium]